VENLPEPHSVPPPGIFKVLPTTVKKLTINAARANDSSLKAAGNRVGESLQELEVNISKTMSLDGY